MDQVQDFEENYDGDLTGKYVVKFNGTIIGIIQKTSRFFVAFQVESGSVETTYTSPLCSEVLEEQSQNNWSRSSVPNDCVRSYVGGLTYFYISKIEFLTYFSNFKFS